MNKTLPPVKNDKPVEKKMQKGQKEPTIYLLKVNKISTKPPVSNVKATTKVYFEQYNSKMTFRLRVHTCSVYFFVPLF